MTLRSSGFMKGQACKYNAEIICEIRNQSALQNIERYVEFADRFIAPPHTTSHRIRAPAAAVGS